MRCRHGESGKFTESQSRTAVDGMEPACGGLPKQEGRRGSTAASEKILLCDRVSFTSFYLPSKNILRIHENEPLMFFKATVLCKKPILHRGKSILLLTLLYFAIII